MEGDLANLPEIVKLKHKYNATIMVDEAHGIGVFGRNGRGVCDYFGLTDEVDLIMGTSVSRLLLLVVLSLLTKVLSTGCVIIRVPISSRRRILLLLQLVLWSIAHSSART